MLLRRVVCRCRSGTSGISKVVVLVRLPEKSYQNVGSLVELDIPFSWAAMASSVICRHDEMI